MNQMNGPDLEPRLRDHYGAMDVGSSRDLTSRVAEAMDRKPRRRSLALLLPRRMARPRRLFWGSTARTILGAGAAVAAVAVVVAVLLPYGYRTVLGPGASPTASSRVDATPDAAPIATASPMASGTPTIDPAAAQVYDAGMTRSGVLWAVRDTTLAISTDSGRTWSENPLPPHSGGAGDSIGAVAVADADHAWVLATFTLDAATPGQSAAGRITTAVIYRTVDGGATWQLSKARSFEGDVSERLLFVDAHSGFAVIDPSSGPGSTVLHTVDGGLTWAVTSTKAPVDGAVTATDEDTLWIGHSPAATAGRPLLRVSRDAGATWSNVSLPGVGATSSADLYVISHGSMGAVTFLSSTEGYVVVSQKLATGYETHYYRTADGGRSWSRVATFGRRALVAPVFVDETHWYQVDFPQSQMEATTDGGQTWSTVGTTTAFGDSLVNFWTADGQNYAALGAVDPSSASDHSEALFLTWDGGETWQPADFNAH
jgi:photosystem II stability/assembly factor-like uncharacterized protein